MNQAECKEYRQAVKELAVNDPQWLLKSFNNPSAHMLKSKRAMAINRTALRKLGLV